MRLLASFKKTLKSSGPTWRSAFAFDIKRAMISKGLKNIDIAQRLDVSEANVSRMLRGDQNLKIETMYMLAASIGEKLNICIGDRYKDEIGFSEVTEDIDFNGDSLDLHKHMKKMRDMAMLAPRNEPIYMEVVNEGAFAFR